ncbi:unnamed protein product, partial [Gongylonema pulchrum]|uniref:MOR2-PAG1_N domain-containing protein n=1 Tax=Gongylonema pulchrum TaxID=637853 RepID=A0A183EC58_9BILA
MPGLVPRVSGSLRSGLSLQSYIERVAQPTPVPCIAGLMEKLDRAEARDLILCTLHLLHFLPRKILTAIISHFESNGLVLNFISLLRVALDFFKYHGKSYTMQATSNKVRGTRRTLVILPHSNSCAGALSVNSATASSHASTSSGFGSFGAATDPVDVIFSQCCIAAVFIKFYKLLVVLAMIKNINAAEPGSMRQYSEGDMEDAGAPFSFRDYFYQSGPLDGLALLIESLLVQMNSR